MVVKSRVLAAGVQVLDILGHTLYNPHAVVDAHGGKATLSISSWSAAVRNLPDPDRPLPPRSHRLHVQNIPYTATSI
ncbi:hypothetical protein L210DRAFT_3552434 [Boletus edulis BED1]|uniref:Uncharacterized protein n=1 Tax=Boletus edulis BED1 TaxID=1328754 RepID=A0AAD4BM31_BOLED|nr:hypothetical protein L210DRAFT_3552434 [Boletus edulis BED1]